VLKLSTGAEFQHFIDSYVQYF